MSVDKIISMAKERAGITDSDEGRVAAEALALVATGLSFTATAAAKGARTGALLGPKGATLGTVVGTVIGLGTTAAAAHWFYQNRMRPAKVSV